MTKTYDDPWEEPTVGEVLSDPGSHTVQQVLRAVAAAETPDGQEYGAISLIGGHPDGEPRAGVFLIGDPDLIKRVKEVIDGYEEEQEAHEEAGDWVEGLTRERH